MIKQFGGYDDAKKAAKYSGSSGLPVGGYVCEILGVKQETTQDGAAMLHVQFDVTEGEYAQFFRKQYENNTNDDKKYKGKTTVWIPRDDGSERDSWTKTSFARWTNSLEDSNPGYTWDWDESKWKGKKIGLLFGETGNVINGKEVVYTECRKPVSVEDVRSGKFKMEAFKAKNGYGQQKSDNETAGFMSIPDGIEEELPFA